MRLSFVLTSAIVIAASTPAAHADTVTFSYDTPHDISHSYGSGSFTYNGPLTSIGLADLTSFTFMMDVNNGGTVLDFGLSDLTSFSATVTGGSISALALQTQFTNPSVGAGSYPEDFVVSGLGSSQAKNYSNDGFNTYLVDTGTVTTNGPGLPSPTPEPSSGALSATGIFALAGIARRRMGRS